MKRFAKIFLVVVLVSLMPMVFMLILSALMWLRIDPTEQLVPEK